MSFLEQFGKIIPNPNMLPITTPELPAYLANLEQSISETYDKMSALLFELGQSYYEHHREDHQTDFEEQLETIRAAYAEIDQYQKLADEVSARKRCPACGAELMEGAVFCSICGAKLPEAVSRLESQKVCPKCQAPVDQDDDFCSLCGTNLRSSREKEGM